MSVTTGLTAAVNSWAGTFNAAMLALISPATFTVNAPASIFESTAFNGGVAVVKTKVAGLRTWNGTITGFLASPKTGILGAVATSGSEYVTNVRSWSMDLSAEVLGQGGDTTGFTQASAGWMDKYPGLVTASGGFEAMVDHSTALTLATAYDATPSTLTFTITTGQTLAATALVSVADISSAVNQMNMVKFSYEVTGHVTIVGSANIIPAASTQATPVAGSLALKLSEQGASDKTLTGNAFWTKIGLNVAPNVLTPVNVAFSGTGALTPA